MSSSKNSYYTWLRVEQHKTRKPSIVLLKYRVSAIFNKSRQTYGSYRIQKKLEREHLNYSRSYVSLIMKELKITSVLSKTFRVSTTDSKHAFPIANNVLNRDFSSVKLGKN
jgi:putative transposase